MRNRQRGGAFKFDKLEFFVLANSQTLQTRELCHMKPTGVLFVQLNFGLK